MKELFVSIVIPVFNERDSLEPLMARINHVLKEMKVNYEVLFVDDGSTDGSFEVLCKLRERNPGVGIIQLRRNFGKSAALSAGFWAAQAPVIVTMDADLQDRPEEIPKLLAKLEEGYDMVLGWRKNRRDKIFKRWSSKVFNSVVSALSGVKLHDMNTGLKAMRREVAQELTLYGELHRFLPVLAQWEGFKVTEVEVKHSPRIYGRSKYGIGKLIRSALDFLTVLLHTRYSRRPLHFFGGIGLAIGSAGIGICLYLLSLRLLYGSILHRYPLLIGGVMLAIVGMQMISIGLLGEMIIRERRPIIPPIRKTFPPNQNAFAKPSQRQP